MNGNLSQVLVVGAGDIGRRVIGLMRNRCAVTATTSTPRKRAGLRRLGAAPVVADLDRPGSLARLPDNWQILLHCAPPRATGNRDQRTRNLLRALGSTPHRAPPKTGSMLTRVIVYLSTSGVYGDCAGALITEARALNPQNPRARRRADAERMLARMARKCRTRLVILRVPGIYAADRLPLARLKAGTPAIIASEDAYTNHIHAADLAGIAVTAMRRARKRARPQVRIYHASDDSRILMGDYFDLVAGAFGLAPPPRLPRAEIAAAVSPALLSFMRESRRLDNSRLKRELRYRFQFPTVRDGVSAARAQA